jgi:hypothetical protein
MKDIYGSVDLEFEGERLTYVLSAEMDFENKNEMEVTSLGIYRKYGRNDQELIDVWDNPSYLYYTLFINVLKPHKQGRKEDIDIKEMNELLAIRGVQMKHLKGIYKLLKKGLELGFFDELTKERLNMS